MELEKESKNICNMIDQLIGINGITLCNKTKLYCEYVLGLDKKYVDGINEDLYEICENYLISIDGKLEKEFIERVMKL